MVTKAHNVNNEIIKADGDFIGKFRYGLIGDSRIIMGSFPNNDHDVNELASKTGTKIAINLMP